MNAPFRHLRPSLVLFCLGLGLTSASAAESPVYRYGAILGGNQEAPAAVATAATGAGTFVIDTDANTVTYRIVYTGLSAAETAAHIHGFADPGVGTGTLHTLPAGNIKVGTWNYSEIQEADILAGRTYVNVHSSAHTGGEIRGQVVPANAVLDGGQTVPPNGSAGTGWGVFNLDTNANTLAYYIVFSGLTGTETVAHIHGAAMPGTGAGTLHTLPAGSPKTGTWNYSESQEEDILSGRTYVNIHSTAETGGEIRGQIVTLLAPIDGGQETPSTGSTGAGFGLFSFDFGSNQLAYDIRFAGVTETAAHIHGYAPAGVGGAGVVHPLPAGSPKRGTWTYPSGNELDIIAVLTYVNIHSAAHIGGEIRGQIEGFPPLILTGTPGGDTPLRTRLGAFPNPFRSRTTIRFELEAPGPVRIDIFDLAGRRVRTLERLQLPAGTGEVVWNGRSDGGDRVAPGIYFFRRSGSGSSEGGRVVVLR
jgi:hypothetical protein